MNHSIVDIAGDPVRGACAFGYKGFTISASTVFDSRAGNVCVFDDGMCAKTLDTVEQAIAFVDSLHK